MEALQRYDWPGNVRQLQNVIRNTVVLNEGDIVEVAMLPDLVASRAPRNGYAATPGAAIAPTRGPEPVIVRPLAEVEREAIEQALQLADGNVPKAAAMLDVSPSTIYRKLVRWESEGRPAAVAHAS